MRISSTTEQTTRQIHFDCRPSALAGSGAASMGGDGWPGVQFGMGVISAPCARSSSIEVAEEGAADRLP
jgi:hypothetical protein